MMFGSMVGFGGGADRSNGAIFGFQRFRMADDSHFEKKQIAINRPAFEISLPNFVSEISVDVKFLFRQNPTLCFLFLSTLEVF